MNTQINQTRTSSIIYRARFMIMAAAVCEQLEKAGIPASFSDINDIYCVCVPPSYASDSRALLQPEPRQGEILYANS